MKAEVNGANITLNVIDLFELMDDEAKQEMIEHLAWQSPIWHEISQGIRGTYASPNFNDIIYRLRVEFFQSEDVPAHLQYTVKALLDTIKHLQEKNRALESTNAQWRKWWGDLHSNPWERAPVPYPYYELEYTPHEDVRAFMKRNGILDLELTTDAE